MKRSTVLSVAWMALSLSSNSIAGEIRYLVTPIDQGAEHSIATGINNRGEVIGDRQIKREETHWWHAFMVKGAEVIDLAAMLPSGESHALGINDQGDVLIMLNTPVTGGSFHRTNYLYTGGSMVNLSALPNMSLIPYVNSLNNHGQIVGGNSEQAAFFDGSQQISLGNLPGQKGSYAMSLNNAGQVLVADGRAYQSFVWKQGDRTEILPPSGLKYVRGYSINEQGHVAGQASSKGDFPFFWDGHETTLMSETCRGWATSVNDRDEAVGLCDNHAFVWTSKSGIENLNGLIDSALGWDLGQARAINNQGQIVGQGQLGDRYFGFLLTPVTAN